MKRGVVPRIVLLLVMVGVLAALAFVLINQYGTSEKVLIERETQRPLTPVLQDPELLSQDPDGDGLANWQEILWGTDKYNPDTDGDGTPDGQEVAEGRNPLVADENDSLLLTAPRNASSTTATDQFSRDLLTQFLVAQDAGVSVSGDVSDALVAETLQSEYLSIPVEQYTINDFTRDSSLTLREYAQTMGLLLVATSGKQGDRDEIEILNEYSLTSNPDVLDGLTEPLKRYTDLRDALLETDIPEGASFIHVPFINGIEAIRSGLVAMQAFEQDPLLGVAGLSVYTQGRATIRDTLFVAQRVFQEAGITYEENDAGYIFLYGI